MTGIERLRKLIADIDVSADPELWYILRDGTESDWDCEERDGKTLGSTLAAIAVQIEREQGGRVSRMRVLAVVMDMERHILGHEGMEDSPVARWARELREALGGNGRDPAADVSVSAYDLLSAGERDALAWVREHGVIESVKAQRRESMPRAAYERKKAGFLDHIAECERALGRRNRRIKELGCRVNDLMIENTELRRRAMPEGYEWPRYESGEPLRYEDRYVYDGREREVWHVDFDSYGEPTILNKDGTRFHPDKGERVERPEPKVLDADGAKISEKRDVWWICEGDERGVHAERLRVETICPNGLIECSPYNGGTWVYLEPSELYVNKPVPASDGKPLREGETVWEVGNGVEFTVIGLPNPGEYQAVKLRLDDGAFTGLDPDQLTHQRPVLDADGVPIKVGDVVWSLTDGKKHEVTGIDLILKEIRIKDESMELGVWAAACGLTHTKPEPVDTWQRIEEDAKKEACAYFGVENGGYGCSECPVKQWEESCDEVKSSDIVRRCRALAERERSE